MARRETSLWPYGTWAALLAAAGILLLGTFLLLALQAWRGWPGDALMGRILPFLFGASLLPVALKVLDFLADRRAVIGSDWFNLDLSRVDLAAAATAETAFLPANLGIGGPVISDTSPMELMAALRESARHPFAVVDIAEGDAWWATRLLAFSAGAVRRGAPQAIVFTGRRENQPGQFLGWATPDVVRDALLDDRPAYRERHDRAVALARQLALVQGGALLPPGMMLHPEVQRLTLGPTDYASLGDAALEQIVMDQLAQYGPEGLLEQPPDRLTLARFQALFGAVIVTETIEVEDSATRQVEAVLASRWPFLALAQKGRFAAMLRQSDAERALLKQLVDQARGRGPEG